MWLPDRGKAKDNEPVYDLPTHFTINRSVKKWAKDAQIEKNVTFHLSRHTFATTLLTWVQTSILLVSCWGTRI